MKSQKKSTRPRIRLGSTTNYETYDISVDSGLMHWKLHVYGESRPAIDFQQYCGAKEPTIINVAIPHFASVQEHGVIIGIINGHLTTPNLYRIRGLHVSDLGDFNTIANLLLIKAYDNARQAGAKAIWALPESEKERELLMQNGFYETEQARDERMFLIKNL